MRNGFGCLVALAVCVAVDLVVVRLAMLVGAAVLGMLD